MQKSDARTRAHSHSFAKQESTLLRISHEVLWSAKRLRIAFSCLNCQSEWDTDMQKNPDYYFRLCYPFDPRLRE
jgi:hypothetical protein